MIEERPPFLGTWRRVYIAVLVYLVCIIGVFAVFGKAFTP